MSGAVIPRVLTIASSDSGGGAGIQADLKAFARCGAHGMSAIVALTAQNTLGVTAIEELSPAFVRAQIDAVLDDIGADAAKTGMLFSAPLIEAVADALETRYLPLVVDPVMVASSGSRLLLPDAVGTLVERLFPLATVVTPNLPEAQALTQLETEDRAALAERLAAMGAPAVLVTGGHGAEPVDHLFDGSTHVAIPVARHRIAATHGAGCTHSAVLAAGLAAGLSLTEAARQAADVAGDAGRPRARRTGRGRRPGARPARVPTSGSTGLRQGGSQVSDSFSAELWQGAAGIYDAILAHPFLTGLTDGSLPHDAFAFYVVQDAIYLQGYAQALAAVASRAATPAQTEMFARHAADAIAVEKTLHGSLLADLGIDPVSARQAEPAPANLAYTSYLLATVSTGSYAEGVGAVLPCYWIYAEVGRELLRRGSPDRRYQQWIDTYGSEEFGAVVQQVIDVVDELGPGLGTPERDRVHRHFRTTSRYEWMFWDMGYRQETWPV